MNEQTAQDGRPIKVMVVDDSRTIRSTAEVLLGKEGYTVITAEDGFDALAKIADDRPDVVFVDIMMPRLDGYQTCTLIKSNPKYREIPVILLSSRDGVFDRARGKLAGSEHYLGKPFSREELVEVVRRLARGQNG
ncbi:MAG: response regulator [Gammaproteobacteria bacterium]